MGSRRDKTVLVPGIRRWRRREPRAQRPLRRVLSRAAAQLLMAALAGYTMGLGYRALDSLWSATERHSAASSKRDQESCPQRPRLRLIWRGRA